jgi:uncharacterized protein YvpB
VRRSVTTLAVVATLVSSLSGLAEQRVARAADVSYVSGWATLGSVTPAAGCWVDASVEVHGGGGGASDVSVGVNLVHGGEVYSADWGMTDGDGIAYLGVDTSWAAPGDEGWLDVLVGGAYAGGMPVSITDSGGCGDNAGMVEIGAEIPLVDTTGSIQSWSLGGEPSSSMVDVGVPTYFQQRNLSCEYASLVIAMGAWGTWVSEYDFDALVGWSENPHWGYRGDITGWWGNTDDYGVYAEALAPALSAYGFYGEVFYAQGDANALTARLDQGIPVLVWIGLWGNTAFYNYTEDGTPYKLVPGLHVVVASGYDDGGVYVSDPATGSKRFYDWGTFMWFWNVMDGMGLAVSPA